MAFRLRHPSSEEFCWLCDVTKSGPMTFEDFSATAPYLGTGIDHDSYMRRCIAEGATPSMVFAIPGVRLHHIVIDSMHAADLGVFQDVIGSLMWVECTTRAWHRNIPDGLKQLNKDMDDFYSANRDRGLSRATPLAWVQIRSKTYGYPYLKTKAAQTRHLSEFAVLLAQRHAHGLGARAPFQFMPTSRLAGRSQEHLRHLVDMTEGMNEYHQSCSATPFVPSECRAAMRKCLVSLAALNKLWREGLSEAQQSVQPFHLRQKAPPSSLSAEQAAIVYGSTRPESVDPLEGPGAHSKSSFHV
jgi:hypothetical protein